MSALRAIPPEEIVKRPKMFWFGPAGSWKTTVALQFPRPYLIDTERGAENDQYRAALEKSGGVVLQTTDLDEIIREVVTLSTERHEYRTLLIDPGTVPYNDALDASARRLANEAKGLDGTEFGKHKQAADRQMKRLMTLLLNLDMNVVITSHAKTKWVKDGDKFKDAGTTFDCFAKMDYVFDVVLEAERRGRDAVIAIVRKTRVTTFPDGDEFPFSYAEIERRYGAAVLTRLTEPILMATPEQVRRITFLLDTIKVEQDVIDKWMKKADADAFSDFTQEAAAKVIGWLEAKLQPKEIAS